MQTPVLEFEGTIEEIQLRLADFAGKRIHITVRPLTERLETKEAILSVEEKILQRARLTPELERAKIPADLTNNLDHYLYGAEKK